MKYSKSKLLTHKNCGRMFYFSYLTSFGKDRHQHSEQLDKGKILHEIYESYNTNPIKCNEYVEFIKDKEDYMDNLVGFHNILIKFGLDKATYNELFVYAEDINVHGYIDAIYIRPSEKDPTKKDVIVVDYKTGKFQSNKMADYRLELYIYEHLANHYINQMNCTKDVKYVTHIGMFFTANEEKSFIEEVKDFKRNNAMKKMNDIIDRIEQGDFTNLSKTMCRFCQFNDICAEFHDDVLIDIGDHVFQAV